MKVGDRFGVMDIPGLEEKLDSSFPIILLSENNEPFFGGTGFVVDLSSHAGRPLVVGVTAKHVFKGEGYDPSSVIVNYGAELTESVRVIDSYSPSTEPNPDVEDDVTLLLLPDDAAKLIHASEEITPIKIDTIIHAPLYPEHAPVGVAGYPRGDRVLEWEGRSVRLGALYTVGKHVATTFKEGEGVYQVYLAAPQEGPDEGGHWDLNGLSGSPVFGAQRIGPAGSWRVGFAGMLIMGKHHAEPGEFVPAHYLAAHRIIEVINECFGFDIKYEPAPE